MPNLRYNSWLKVTHLDACITEVPESSPTSPTLFSKSDSSPPVMPTVTSTAVSCSGPPQATSSSSPPVTPTVTSAVVSCSGPPQTTSSSSPPVTPTVTSAAVSYTGPPQTTSSSSPPVTPRTASYCSPPLVTSLSSPSVILSLSCGYQANSSGVSVIYHNTSCHSSTSFSVLRITSPLSKFSHTSDFIWVSQTKENRKSTSPH